MTCKNSDEKRQMKAEGEKVQSLFQVSQLRTNDVTEFMMQMMYRMRYSQHLRQRGTSAIPGERLYKVERVVLLYQNRVC